MFEEIHFNHKLIWNVRTCSGEQRRCVKGHLKLCGP